jgi:acetyl-CoA carboxylase alpha subunit
LGYSEDEVLDFNINNLELAIEGKLDFLKKTNPWRTQKDIDEENASMPDSQENVAKKLQAWAVAMQGRKPDRNRPRGVREGVVLPPGMEMPVPPGEKK